MMQTIEQIVDSMKEKLNEVDEAIMHEVVGVTMALDDLRKALNDVDSCLARRDFEKAAALGYSSVSSGFVFLQRTLAGLHSEAGRKETLVSEIAAQAECAYEDALPHVDAVMPMAQPRNAAS